MEKSIVTTGKTIELAIEAALTQLRMDRDSVSVEVLKNARSGFLGIGASPAEVKVTYQVPDEPTAQDGAVLRLPLKTEGAPRADAQRHLPPRQEAGTARAEKASRPAQEGAPSRAAQAGRAP